jgi:hypothetical protein
MAVTLNASTSSGFIQTADTSGELNLQSNGTTKLSVLSTGVSGVITQGTAVASTSGTSIDFTSIPSWVKRITVMFNGVSTNGTSGFLVQLGDSGGIENTGYVSSGGYIVSGGGTTVLSSTAGFVLTTTSAATIINAAMTINLMGSNLWCAAHSGGTGSTQAIMGGGTKTLSDVLDRIRITSVNGTDTFDAGSINILYEG